MGKKKKKKKTCFVLIVQSRPLTPDANKLYGTKQKRLSTQSEAAPSQPWEIRQQRARAFFKDLISNTARKPETGLDYLKPSACIHKQPLPGLPTHIPQQIGDNICFFSTKKGSSKRRVAAEKCRREGAV